MKDSFPLYSIVKKDATEFKWICSSQKPLKPTKLSQSKDKSTGFVEMAKVAFYENHRSKNLLNYDDTIEKKLYILQKFLLVTILELLT